MPANLYLNQSTPNPAYLSPALSIVKSANIADQDAATPILDIVPNPTTFQNVRVEAGNDGTSPANNVKIQVWARAFGTNAASGLYLDSLGGLAGIVIPAGALTINNGQSQAQERHWNKNDQLGTSDPNDPNDDTQVEGLLDVNGEIHCCLLANVYSTDNPNDFVTDPAALDVVNNRRHAQRNMTIKAQAEEELAFSLWAGNPDPEREERALLQLVERTPREFARWELAELDRFAPWIRRTRTGHAGGLPGIEFVIGGKAYPVKPGRPLKRLELSIEDAGQGPKVPVTLGPDEARRMRIHAALPDEEFVLRIFDVLQFHGKRAVGGARVVSLKVPEELRRPRNVAA